MSQSSKTILVWVALGAVLLVSLMYRSEKRERYVNPRESLSHIQSAQIQSYHFRDHHLILQTVDGQSLRVVPVDKSVLDRLKEFQIPFRGAYAVGSSRTVSGVFSDPVMIVVLTVVALIAIFLLLRQRAAGSTNSVFQMRRSKARSIEQSDTAHFTDIGGNHEAVELFADLVDFLQVPERWRAVSARLPRGILLVGPPGTGKTLLARAVAGETKASFFYTSATEFVEMFVGVGPARIRDTFERAAARQPAIIFIDELDAIGRRRGSGMGTIHEEREQTLNQLLVMLDGLERYEQLIVMAATNRLDVLDPALLRSGRFDRILRLDVPSLVERLEILVVHTRNKPLDNSVSLEWLASETDGFTGADLELLTNQAALAAVRRARQTTCDVAGQRVVLTRIDFEKAFESLRRSHRQFNRLDAVLVESLSQFAEPAGRAVVQLKLTTGTVLEGDVIWMNAVHIKLRLADGSEVVVAKELTEQLVTLEGTEAAPVSDFVPDRWAGRHLESG